MGHDGRPQALGEWTPTLDELAAALIGVDEHCVSPEAVKACATKVGSSAVNVSFDALKGPSGCSVSVKPASWAGHHFVIADVLYRNKGSQFAGITFIQKQRGKEFFPYAEIMSGDAVECGAAPGSKPPSHRR